MNVPADRLQTLAALRPVTTLHEAWPDQNRDTTLQRVLGDAEPAAAVAADRRRVVLRRRAVLVGGLATALCAAVAVPLAMQSPTYAATPPLLRFTPVAGQQSVQQFLADLARRAQTQPAPSGQGPYGYIHTKGWYLHVSADEHNRVLDSGIAEVDRQLWVGPDGSGRLATVDGTTAAPNMTLGPGRLATAASDTDAIRAQLNPSGSAPGWVRAVPEVWSRQVVTPDLHAHLLDILAQQPGIAMLGDTTDRVGRRGVAIGIEDDRATRERLILVLHPDTGALLDAETVVLTNSELPVRAPATIAYTVWLGTGYTVDTHSQP